MKKLVVFLFILNLFFDISAQNRIDISLKTVTGGIMKYYLSLPKGWSPNHKYPVVIALEAAEKEFRLNAERFTNARGQMPFIIVSPIIVTNGFQGRKDPSVYPYSKENWNTIDQISDCKFDMDGIVEIIKDVHQKYNGNEKVFITGFEAGTHLLYAMIFSHPNLFQAAAPVAGNYIGRCVDKNSFSDKLSGVQLPIRNFFGSKDKDWGEDGKLYSQWEDAKQIALVKGYKNISEVVIKNKTHVPLPEETLAFFYELYKKGSEK